MKTFDSITKKYLIMQYPKTKRAVAALTALSRDIREPSQGGDRVKLILARRSQVCNNGCTNDNSLAVGKHLEGVVATPKTARRRNYDCTYTVHSIVIACNGDL